MNKIVLLLCINVFICSAYKTILFTRHGHRSPKVYTEIDTKYYWDIPEEDLTDIGLN